MGPNGAGRGLSDFPDPTNKEKSRNANFTVGKATTGSARTETARAVKEITAADMARGSETVKWLKLFADLAAAAIVLLGCGSVPFQKPAPLQTSTLTSITEGSSPACMSTN